MDPSKRDDILNQARQEIALANAQMLLQTIADKCFRKCVYKPGTSLDNSEQKCVAMCMDRYMDTWDLTAKTYASRLQREMS
ncbi:mitochondrial import inner membrane translocase subunit Tim13-B-like isoform X14 [Pecten maximus]|uniref:mitochondrial import inner membrane translocase subunit Tim13-B-like isoform X14 n=1 Tax=Pecten maximus TaxID=6579 RepID=UPI001458F972|nr:mitochondrial import inner membrane translocase subunit Tim13-B-like isoform X14 [Pecten maximus]